VKSHLARRKRKRRGKRPNGPRRRRPELGTTAFRRTVFQGREAEKRARQDRILLALYASVEDIERARDERLDRIDTRIDKLTESIARIRRRLTRGEGKNDDATKIRELSEARARLEFERQDIEERFERDIRRFRELKGLDQGPVPASFSRGSACPRPGR
jgi:chromosome segregation ATPase